MFRILIDAEGDFGSGLKGSGPTHCECVDYCIKKEAVGADSTEMQPIGPVSPP